MSPTSCRALLALVAGMVAACAEERAPAGRDEAWASHIVAFTPGEGAGYGQDRSPDIVLGPPRGGGHTRGSLDVLSLGIGGEITLELERAAIDGPGDDLVVFENAFFAVGGPTATIFAEPGFVSVSEEGATFVDFPCVPEAPSYAGCAGAHAVYADGALGPVDLTDVERTGGDRFDLGTIGVARARFVRIRDSGVGPRFGGSSEGFDLDALGVIHAE